MGRCTTGEGDEVAFVLQSLSGPSRWHRRGPGGLDSARLSQQRRACNSIIIIIITIIVRIIIIIIMIIMIVMRIIIIIIIIIAKPHP